MFVLLLVFDPFVLVPRVVVEFEPFKRLLAWDEVASFFVLLVLAVF